MQWQYFVFLPCLLSMCCVNEIYAAGTLYKGEPLQAWKERIEHSDLSVRREAVQAIIHIAKTEGDTEVTTSILLDVLTDLDSEIVGPAIHHLGRDSKPASEATAYPKLVQLMRQTELPVFTRLRITRLLVDNNLRPKEVLSLLKEQKSESAEFNQLIKQEIENASPLVSLSASDLKLLIRKHTQEQKPTNANQLQNDPTEMAELEDALNILASIEPDAEEVDIAFSRLANLPVFTGRFQGARFSDTFFRRFPELAIKQAALLLKDEKVDQRLLAITLMKRVGPRGKHLSSKLLLDAANDQDLGIQVEIIKTLCLLTPETCRPLLPNIVALRRKGLLHYDDSPAMNVLYAHLDEAIPLLQMSIESDLKQGSSVSFANTHQTILWLRNALAYDNPKGEGMDILSQLALSGCTHQSIDIRRNYATNLKYCTKQINVFIPSLISLTDDPHSSVRLAAIISLTKLDPIEYPANAWIATLGGIIAEKSPDTQITALKQVSLFSRQASSLSKILIENLGQNPDAVCLQAAITLYAVNPKELEHVLPVLNRHVSDLQQPLSFNSLRILEDAGSEAMITLPALQRRLAGQEEIDPWKLISTITSIDRSQIPKHLPSLEKSLRNIDMPHSQMNEYALLASWGDQAKPLLPLLRTRFSTHSQIENSPSAMVIAACITIVEQDRDGEAITFIRKQISDDNHGMQFYYFAHYLERLGKHSSILVPEIELAISKMPSNVTLKNILRDRKPITNN